MEPPSPELRRQLAELNLCTPYDLWRCRSRVRRLARDLPAFDSVWLDALVQLGRLTPYQARVLEEYTADVLCAGPCVVIQPLERCNVPRTYLARLRDRDELCVLKQQYVPRSRRAELEETWKAALEQFERVRHPGLVLPRAVVWDEEVGVQRAVRTRPRHAGIHTHVADGSESAQASERIPAGPPPPAQPVEADVPLVIVSRFAPGPTARDLLIRRGRFPGRAVLELARHLVAALAALERIGRTHGEISLQNLRLSPDGRPVLVDGCVAAITQPDLLIRATDPPDRYDGMAPERITEGTPPTIASDLYALGCLLWHLLAGRPPFPIGDPLAKLLAHRTRRIEAIRQWAPDTPAELAELIDRLTEPDPADRPRSFAALLEEGWQPRAGSRSRLRHFVQSFVTPKARVPRTPRRMPVRSLAAAAAVAIAALTLVAAHRLGHDELLLRLLVAARHGEHALADVPAPRNGLPSRRGTKSLPGTDVSAAGRAQATPTVGATTSRTGQVSLTLEPLPPPDENGRVLLRSGAAYLADRPVTADRVWVATTQPEGTEIGPHGAIRPVNAEQHGLTPATIVVGADGWKLQGRRVILDDIVLLRLRSPQATPAGNATARSAGTRGNAVDGRQLLQQTAWARSLPPVVQIAASQLALRGVTLIDAVADETTLAAITPPEHAAGHRGPGGGKQPRPAVRLSELRAAVVGLGTPLTLTVPIAEQAAAMAHANSPSFEPAVPGKTPGRNATDIRTAAVRWDAPDPSVQQPGYAILQRVSVIGMDTGLWCQHAPERIDLSEATFVAVTAAVHLESPPPAGRVFEVLTRRCTVRGASSMLRVVGRREPSGGLVRWRHDHCRLEFTAAPANGLLQWLLHAPAAGTVRCEVTGTGTTVQAPIAAGRFIAATGELGTLRAPTIRVAGIAVDSRTQRDGAGPPLSAPQPGVSNGQPEAKAERPGRHTAPSTR